MKDEYAERRAVRSVYVSKIPPDISEEKMKEIFSSVGPVSSFRIVYDNETKRSKGYGYCEYLDKETALTAIMNFSGYELSGRTLMVESANNEKSIREIQAIIDEDAPETISKAVASLPPDQMFELMRQIKQCIENNAEEARAMLINNPPLTYALLEAQLVMGIVDLQEAWALIEAAPLQKQDAVEAPHAPPASALRNAVTALNEAREAAENLNSEARNSATDANRHSLIDTFVADQNSRDSRTMDSSTTEQHPRLPADAHIIDYNSDSRSMDDMITDANPPLEARSRDTRPLIDSQNIDIHSGDSRPAEQHSLTHIVDSRSGSTLIAEHFGANSHSKDSFPITSRSQNIEPQHVDPRIMDVQSLDRRTVDPRVADRRPLDPRIADRPSVDLRVADRPSIDPRIPDRLSVDPRNPDRLSLDPRIPDRPSIDPHIADRLNVDPRIMEASQEARTGDPRSSDSRPLDPRALYSRSVDARIDPRLGERRMDPRIGDWRFVESQGADPISMDSDAAEPHFDPRHGNPQFDNRSGDPRAVQVHPTDPRSLNARSMGARMMDSRPVNSRPPDPYFTDHRDTRSRDGHEMGSSMADVRAQDPRMSHMGPDFRVPDRGYGGELHNRDPRLVRAGPHPVQPPLLKDRPATTTPGFPRSTVSSPRPSLAPSGVSHDEPGNASGGAAPTTSDEEKAALIMQVLQLSDEQIAGLSPEQQQSILVLKEQIAKSTLHQ